METTRPMPEPIRALRDHLAVIADLRAAASILQWDQETHMPPGGAGGRAVQMATLTRLAHEAFISPRTAELLESCERIADSLNPDSDDAAIIRMTRRDYIRQARLPAPFVAERARQASLSTEVWKDARRRNDFAAYRPALETMVGFARRTAEYLGYAEHIYDALLDLYEPDMTAREVDAIFARLRQVTVPLVQAIGGSGRPVDDAVLRQEYAEEEQKAFGLAVAQAFGYDLTRGRLDVSAHPFATAFHTGDVRITTRYARSNLAEAIFGIFHEAGHAMYEQGVAPELNRTLLARGASLGLHESQSRLWENIVGRSRAFWEHYLPALRARFPRQLGGVDAETFYRAVNKVRPSLIRTAADEVTYNLHIMLRFDLEKALLEGTLRPGELPDAWGAKMEEYLGVRPPTDADGVMQDIHWSGGSLGYFPTYTLGNVISVQLYEAACAAHAGIPEEIGRGEFSTLLGWLRRHVHRHGRKYLPREILQRATGQALTPEPYLRYLRRKFGEIYGLPAAGAAEEAAAAP